MGDVLRISVGNTPDLVIPRGELGPGVPPSSKGEGSEEGRKTHLTPKGLNPRPEIVTLSVPHPLDVPDILTSTLIHESRYVW